MKPNLSANRCDNSGIAPLLSCRDQLRLVLRNGGFGLRYPNQGIAQLVFGQSMSSGQSPKTFDIIPGIFEVGIRSRKARFSAFNSSGDLGIIDFHQEIAHIHKVTLIHMYAIDDSVEL